MEQSQEEYKVEVLYGKREVKFKVPELVEKTEIRGWWIFKRNVKVWWIEYEFCCSGPYYNKMFANQMFGYALAAYGRV